MTDAIRSQIETAFDLRKGNNDAMDESGSNASSMISRTELDTHVNIVVVKRNSYVLPHTGISAEVNSFTPDHVAMKIEIVDAAV